MDSLKKRYFYKLIANLIGFPLSLIAQAIIPRGLGAKSYGDFNFLTDFFKQVMDFLDAGTSFGFYTKLSQRVKDSGLVAFYFHYIGLASLATLTFVIIMQLGGIYPKIWPAQSLLFIYLASFLGILNWILQIINSMADAYGVTVDSEKVKIIQKFFGTIFLVVLFVLNRLNLVVFFGYNYLILFLLGGVFIWILYRHGHYIFRNLILPFKRIKEYSKEFYHYTSPLFIYTVFSLTTGLFDRWILQFYGGSIQQGFYSLSYQIGNLCFLFTSAMTPLLMREYSIAFGKNDLTQITYLFRRYIPLFYSVSSFFACFIATQASKVIYIFAGNEYEGAIIAMVIMAFYPIHLTYGQLSNSVFFATNQTRLYRNIGIIFMTVGSLFTYFMIAPNNRMGLNLGATGLALRMVLVQFLAVNVQLYFNARFLGFSFRRHLGHQAVCAGSLLLLALLSTFSVNKFFGVYAGNIIFSFILTGILYTLMTGILAYCVPVIFGIKRQDIRYIMEMVYKK